MLLKLTRTTIKSTPIYRLDEIRHDGNESMWVGLEGFAAHIWRRLEFPFRDGEHIVKVTRWEG